MREIYVKNDPGHFFGIYCDLCQQGPVEHLVVIPVPAHVRSWGDTFVCLSCLRQATDMLLDAKEGGGE